MDEVTALGAARACTPRADTEGRLVWQQGRGKNEFMGGRRRRQPACRGNGKVEPALPGMPFEYCNSKRAAWPTAWNGAEERQPTFAATLALLHTCTHSGSSGGLAHSSGTCTRLALGAGALHSQLASPTARSCGLAHAWLAWQRQGRLARFGVLFPRGWPPWLPAASMAGWPPSLGCSCACLVHPTCLDAAAAAAALGQQQTGTGQRSSQKSLGR